MGESERGREGGWEREGGREGERGSECAKLRLRSLGSLGGAEVSNTAARDHDVNVFRGPAVSGEQFLERHERLWLSELNDQVLVAGSLFGWVWQKNAEIRCVLEQVPACSGFRFHDLGLG